MQKSLILLAAIAGTTSMAFAGLKTAGTSGPSHGNGGTDAVLYQIDDGATENSLGTNGGTDLIWLQQFPVAAGGEIITDISVAYGTALFPGSATNGAAVQILLYEDINGNVGGTTDAVLKFSFPSVVANADTDILNVYNTPDTVVNGNFLVGALIRNTTPTNNGFPVAMDESAPTLALRSYVGFANPGTLNENNLASMGGNYGAVEGFGFPANFLIRANGEAVPEPSSAMLLIGAGAMALRRRSK